MGRTSDTLTNTTAEKVHSASVWKQSKCVCPYSRVCFEVPIVDSFNQLLGDFDDLLLPC